MPSSFGEDSDLCRMLRLLAPHFEHRLFLSATPHNGHTRCFTGLLEILDPVRFSQTETLRPAERERIQQVVLRRLKREINTRTTPPRFCTRNPPQALGLAFSPAEIALSLAFDGFRRAIKKLISSSEKRRRRAGSFAVEILGKRLLSCPTAFAESWRRCKEGLAQEQAAEESDVDAARRNVEREIEDDREAQSREANAAGVVGSWMKSVASDLINEISAIDRAIAGLKFDLSRNDMIEQTPSADARFDSLVALIERILRTNFSWRSDERIVVFTEYKTTLDYIVRRLRERYEPESILTLFGGMDEIERDLVKQAFNNPQHKVRILVATDAAAEGLNLQRTARYLLHFDCPWNPSKLEQRNGRIDRHGQPRDVTIHHFVSEQDQDLRFLSHVLRKADEIREDLGSANDLFDQAAHRRLVDGEPLAAVQADLDRHVAAGRGRASFEADATTDTASVDRTAEKQIKELSAEIDLDPKSLRETLEAALAIRVGRPQLECSAEEHTCKILHPALPGWSEVIDDSLRRPVSRATRGPVARIAFSLEPFLEDIGGRVVFSPRSDVLLMHLMHPMLQRALGALTRRRFPGGDQVSRWTVRLGELPPGAEALVLFSVEELAVNDLRETFHHWVRTMSIPIKHGRTGQQLPHRDALAFRGAIATHDPAHYERAREILDEISSDLKKLLGQHTKRLSAALLKQLQITGGEARALEDERYRSRQGEISSLIAENTLAKLEREIQDLKEARRQGFLFDEESRIDEIDRSIEEKQKEIGRRTRHYVEVREQLEKERDRILKFQLPRRHAMSGSAQVFPVSIEVRLPRDAA
jgi:hypothetical protein